MTGHVPVRFSESVIARVKLLALRDGVTVSTWIRNLVLKEVERRSPPMTASSFDPKWVTFASDSEPDQQSYKVDPEDRSSLVAVLAAPNEWSGKLFTQTCTIKGQRIMTNRK